MNWKEFFRPSKLKLAILLLLFLIMPAPHYLVIYCITLAGHYCPPSGWLMVPFAGLGILIDSIERQFSSDHLASFLFLLIVSYLLSCLIVFVYNKYRGKKRFLK